MPQLDPYLALLAGGHGDTLTLADGDVAASIAPGAASAFRYQATDAAYLVRAGERDGRYHVAITIEARSAAPTPALGTAAAPAAAVTPTASATPAAAPPPAATPAARPTPAAAPRQVAAGQVAAGQLDERRAASRTAIDGLLRTMVQRKASDLH